MQWYYAIKGQQYGPVDEAEIRRLIGTGELAPTDHVWNETMSSGWRHISTIPSLSSVAATPPPLPEAPVDASEISCTAPAGRAWDLMAQRLFKPFDLGKWFVLGFTAWLATFGESHGGSFPLRGLGDLGNAGNRSSRASTADVDAYLKSLLGQAASFFHKFGGIIVTVTVIAVLLAVIVGVALMWLRSRGKFMFLDNVARDRAEVAAPWTEFQQHGNSLFKWNLVYALICMAVAVLLIWVGVVSILLPCLRAKAWLPDRIPLLAAEGTVWLLFALVTGGINRCIEDFIVPIMYRQDLTAIEAWGVLVALLKGHAGKFVVYVLFYLVLGLAAGALVAVVILLTCCIAGVLMVIPYIGAVVLLPVTTFFRLYSVAYLGQFGARFRIELEGD